MNCNDFFSIARRGIPFLSDGGRAFITLPAQSLGCHTLPIRSRAFRHWFYDQCFSAYDAIPSAHAFSNILHHLEAQAARDPDRCGIRVPFRVDCRGVFPKPKKFSSTSPTPMASSSKLPPWLVPTPGGAHPSRYTWVAFRLSRSLPRRIQPDRTPGQGRGRYHGKPGLHNAEVA